MGNNWEITKHIEGRDGQVKLIRGKTERKQLAVLKIYKNNNFKDYSKELKALQSLKGKILRKKKSPYNRRLTEYFIYFRYK